MSNPTEEIDVSFAHYLSERKIKQQKHLLHGIPDYAYELDYIMRQKVCSMPGVFKLGKMMCSTVVPKWRQRCLRQSTLVSGKQYPEIYQMSVQCARILGIGVPAVFIVNDQSLNAFTLATEDADPIVILHSGLVERLSSEELHAVIGHECGHIHNNHGIYTFLAEKCLDKIFEATSFFIPQAVMQLLMVPAIKGFLNTWSRAGEITADRAGIICRGEADSTFSGEAKLASGGLLGNQYGTANIDAFTEQYEKYRNVSARWDELYDTHPAGARRILAAKEFLNSEVFYSWHPELKKPDMKLLSKEELDNRCERFVSVLKSKRA